MKRLRVFSGTAMMAALAVVYGCGGGSGTVAATGGTNLFAISGRAMQPGTGRVARPAAGRAAGEQALEGDSPIPNATAKLIDIGSGLPGTVVATTTTDSNGNFTFSDLNPVTRATDVDSNSPKIVQVEFNNQSVVRLLPPTQEIIDAPSSVVVDLGTTVATSVIMQRVQELFTEQGQQLDAAAIKTLVNETVTTLQTTFTESRQVFDNKRVDGTAGTVTLPPSFVEAVHQEPATFQTAITQITEQVQQNVQEQVKFGAYLSTATKDGKSDVIANAIYNTDGSLILVLAARNDSGAFVGARYFEGHAANGKFSISDGSITAEGLLAPGEISGVVWKGNGGGGFAFRMKYAEAGSFAPAYTGDFTLDEASRAQADGETGRHCIMFVKNTGDFLCLIYPSTADQQKQDEEYLIAAGTTGTDGALSGKITHWVKADNPNGNGNGNGNGGGNGTGNNGGGQPGNPTGGLNVDLRSIPEDSLFDMLGTLNGDSGSGEWRIKIPKPTAESVQQVMSGTWSVGKK